MNNIRDTKIVGIINLSPESFGSESYSGTNSVLVKVRELVEDGADCIDIGAQSTKPGSIQLTIEEELKRVKGIIRAIKTEFPSLPISIDSTRSEVIKLAIKEGANMVNDISGGRFDSNILNLIKRHNLKYILTHSCGSFEDLHKKYKYFDLIADLKKYFEENVEKLEKLGVKRKQIILDPGIGFSKASEENIEIIKGLGDLHSLNLPIYIGLSRKKFIGNIINEVDPRDRDVGTTVFHTICLEKGISYIRTHNVKYAKQCLDICKTVF